MDAIAEVEPRDASPVAPATAGRGLSTALVAVQHWVRCNLPVEQSALAYDLILLVIDRTLTDSPLTLKELFHSLPYSETGVRKQLTRLRCTRRRCLHHRGRESGRGLDIVCLQV